MKYAYQIRSITHGVIELRFPDLVGARELFATELDAEKGAMALFLEAVQYRFDSRQQVPVPVFRQSGDRFLVVPLEQQARIHLHNAQLEELGEIQGVSE